MKKNFLKEYKEDALNNCSILYKNLHKPCTETCMCWGWEFHDGWNEVVNRLSYKLEGLNRMVYDRFRVRIQADQVKEKYGTLRFYYSVHIDPPSYLSFISNIFGYIHDYMRRKFDFKIRRVVDEEDKIVDARYDFVDEAEYNKHREHFCNDEFHSEDGKFWKTYKVYKVGRYHNEPTQHKFIYNLMQLMWKFKIYTNFSRFYKYNTDQIIISRYVDDLAEKYVSDAYKECCKRCEECGTEIGTEDSPSIQTGGWISYICEKCDFKSKINIIIGIIQKSKLLEEISNDSDKMNIYNNALDIVNSEEYIDVHDIKKSFEELNEMFNSMNFEGDKDEK